METMGDRIKKAREAAGLSQAGLGKAAGGLKQQLISQLERGENRTTSHSLEIALALGVSPKWLIDGKGPMKPEIPVLSAQEIRFLKAFRRAPEDLREIEIRAMEARYGAEEDQSL